MKKFLLLLLFGNMMLAQTVSTYFSDPDKKITDAVVFDEAGNLYGSDFNGDTVYKVTPEGVATAFVSGLNNPNGLAFDSNGNLFVVEYSGSSIHKYDSTGTLLESFSVGPFPSGLIKAQNSDDMIFTLTSNNSVNILSASGGITELYQGTPLNAPVGLAFDDIGNLYAGNYVGREIYKVFNGSTEYVATVPDGGSNSFLAFITYGNNKLWGTVFFTGHKIYSINPDGVDDVNLFAGNNQGSDDGDIVVATFDSPSGLAYKNDENALYISEFTSAGNVRKIDNILAINDFTSETSLSLYPNPVNETLQLSGDFLLNLVETNITIYDFSGKVLNSFTKTISGNTLEINKEITNLKTGNYLIEIVSGDNVSITKSFIKR